jgi:UDPglucose--hexose-1-phosphate uridylyltransferase
VSTHRDQIRLMLQVTSPRRAADKLKFLAGSEAAMGAWIGDVAPEQAAMLIRDAVARSDAADAATSGSTSTSLSTLAEGATS